MRGLFPPHCGYYARCMPWWGIRWSEEKCQEYHQLRELARRCGVARL